jgi:hypothetical protein
MTVCVPLVNICEHCPNFRTDAGFLAVLRAQRADAQALAADAGLGFPSYRGGIALRRLGGGDTAEV